MRNSSLPPLHSRAELHGLWVNPLTGRNFSFVAPAAKIIELSPPAEFAEDVVLQLTDLNY